jgi:hypothetical protein
MAALMLPETETACSTIAFSSPKVMVLRPGPDHQLHHQARHVVPHLPAFEQRAGLRDIYNDLRTIMKAAVTVQGPWSASAVHIRCSCGGRKTDGWATGSQRNDRAPGVAGGARDVRVHRVPAAPI